MPPKSKQRIKWTEQMQRDVLECKKKALEELSLQNQASQNGKKRGYVKRMLEFWIQMGYGHLGLTGQNLCDRASYLEKRKIDTTRETVNLANDFQISLENDVESRVNEVEYAVSQPHLVPNLHSTSENNFFIDNESHYDIIQPNAIDCEQDNECIPGSLPGYIPANKPYTISWGRRADQSLIVLSSSTIIDAYNEIVRWKKNVFLVPYGKIGRDFIDQVTSHINDWNNSTDKYHVSLKAVFVLLAVGLQKPGPKSKSKDHQDVLAKRLALWREGEINKLLRECRMIQSRIGKLKASAPHDKTKIFAKLVLDGQINAALRFLSDSSSGGVLPLTDDVMTQLKDKHPNPQPAKLGSFLFGPIDDAMPESIYSEINEDMVRQAALRTKGAGGPSGIDANGFRRMIASKSFKQSSSRLSEAMAVMTKRLCTEFVDPETIEPLIASRLIPLDKGEGAVRPIGVGEVMRRIIGKCVMNVVKRDVLEASGSLQLCAGQKSGNEAAIHAMYTIFEADETDVVLLIDATNAFNTLNRQAALHNIRVQCPIIATFAINSYRLSARLFITGGKEILSAEGTTQGDPLAMGLYGISIQPLITSLQGMCEIKQCWFADDASGAGRVNEIKKWWDALITIGPNFGYYPNSKKCWIISKPEREIAVKEVFKESAINVTVQGQRHLGAAIGSREFLEEYVNDKVTNWIKEIAKLAEFAVTQPQASYAAYTFGLKHRWTYFLRTLPDIEDLLEPLEYAISNVFIPAITDQQIGHLDRDVLALPVRFGGLGLANPASDSELEYTSSVKVTAPLIKQIVSQVHELPEDSLTRKAQMEMKEERVKTSQTKYQKLKESAPPKTRRALELASEKGSSMWLTSLPLKEMGFNLNKREFRDGLCLRYEWPIPDIPSTCVCSEPFTVDHAMICKRGGFVIQRHNELRDLEADLLNIVCKDVTTEPVLQDVQGEHLTRGSNKSHEARLDIHARGFWEPHRSAFFDVRVCHPNADSYRELEPQKIYRLHENDKKRQYQRRVLEIEHGTFTPLIFTTTGGMGKECLDYHRRLAELIATKKGEDYAKTISWMRTRISFALLRSALVCIRGTRAIKKQWNFVNNDIEVDNIEGEIKLI